jgi:hypothetical protein
MENREFSTLTIGAAYDTSSNFGSVSLPITGHLWAMQTISKVPNQELIKSVLRQKAPERRLSQVQRLFGYMAGRIRAFLAKLKPSL